MVAIVGGAQLIVDEQPAFAFQPSRQFGIGQRGESPIMQIGMAASSISRAVEPAMLSSSLSKPTMKAGDHEDSCSVDAMHARRDVAPRVLLLPRGDKGCFISALDADEYGKEIGGAHQR